VPRLAITRDVPESFARALAKTPAAIDVAAARAQHAGYRGALAEAGLTVVNLAADDASPDCCFIEDTAVVAGGVALITCPGAPSRRPEVDPVAVALSAYMPIERMQAPATLDGGDCMLVGTTLYVGRSARTNEAGVARLTDVMQPRGVRVVAIEMSPEILHLKCVCSSLGDRVLLAEGSIDPAVFGDAAIVSAPADDPFAGNAVAVGDRVLATADSVRTHAALRAAGYRVIAVATPEMRKADGALTCLSIVLPWR
jgi:dimethylargininase